MSPRLLGICAWIFGERPLGALAADLAAWGYDGLEINGEPGLYDPSEVRRVVEGHRLRVLGITASCDWPTDSRDLANPDPLVRRRAVDHFRRCLDLARETGAPVVGLIPGAVGRIRAITQQRDEWAWSVEAVRRVAEHAAAVGVPVAVEALNRYESHLVNTAAQALDFVAAVGSPAVGIILDAFHMNIEEADPVGTVRRAGDRLLGFHVADNTREGLGKGRLDLAPHLAALREIGYAGALTVECTAPGRDPFKGVSDRDSLDIVRRDAAETARRLRALLGEG